MNKWLKILLGLIILNGAILLTWYSGTWGGYFWNFKHAAWELLKGSIVWAVLLIGILLILLGISDVKS